MDWRSLDFAGRLETDPDFRNVIHMHFDDPDTGHPPYSFLNVIGTPWSERLQRELDRFGLTSHEATPEGFRTAKELANTASHGMGYARP